MRLFRAYDVSMSLSTAGSAYTCSNTIFSLTPGAPYLCVSKDGVAVQPAWHESHAAHAQKYFLTQQRKGSSPGAMVTPQHTRRRDTRRSAADPSTFRVIIPLRELSGVDLEPSVAITVAADAASGRVTFRGERACLGDAALDERFRLTLDATLDARARRRQNRLWRLGLRGRGSGGREGGSVAQGERAGSAGGPVEVAAEAESSWSSGDGASGYVDRQGAQQAALGDDDDSSGVAESSMHAGVEELHDAPRPQSAGAPAAGGRQVHVELHMSCLGICMLPAV